MTLSLNDLKREIVSEAEAMAHAINDIRDLPCTCGLGEEQERSCPHCSLLIVARKRWFDEVDRLFGDYIRGKTTSDNIWSFDDNHIGRIIKSHQRPSALQSRDIKRPPSVNRSAWYRLAKKICYLLNEHGN